MRQRVECVGGIVRDSTGRLLMIRRGTEPAYGCWSVPGGRVEAGESLEEAVARELQEETGLRVEVGALVGVVERDGPHGSLYVIHDFACTVIGDDPLAAGDDALDAAWVTPEDLADLECSPGLLESLREWGILAP